MQLSLLNLLRFLAAIHVVSCHFMPNCQWMNHFIYDFIKNGNIAVIFFFVLSGFVMVLAYGKNKISIKNFYVKRFARLYPVYILALLFAVGYTFIFGRKLLPIEQGYEIFYMLGVQSWFSGHETVANPPAWSLSVEFVFYFLFPLVFPFVQRNKKLMLIVISFFWSLTVLWFFSKHNFNSSDVDLFNFHPIYHLSTFFIGVFTGIIWIQNKDKFNFKLTWTVILLLLIICLIPLPLFYKNHNPILAPLFALFIFFIASYENKKSIKNYKLFNFLGSLSYGIYILHWPLNLYYRFLVDSFNMSEMVVFLGLVVFLIVVSVLVFKYFEQPLKIKLHSYFSIR